MSLEKTLTALKSREQRAAVGKSLRQTIHRARDLLADGVHGLMKWGRSKVSVTRGGVRLRMAEQRANYGEAETVSSADARETVAQIVQSDILELRSLANMFPRFPYRSERFR